MASLEGKGDPCPVALDTFVDCSAQLARASVLHELLKGKKARVTDYLAALGVESGWREDQVLGLTLACLLCGPDTIL